MKPSEVPDAWVRQVAGELLKRLDPSGAPSAAGESGSGHGSTGGYGSASGSGGGYDGPVGSASAGGHASTGGYGASSSAPDGASSCGCGGGGVCGCGPAVAGCRIPGFENGHDRDRLELLRDYGVARLGCLPGVGSVDQALAAMIDHTILKPEATDRQVIQLCEEAHCHGFASVCIQPIWVPLAARVLDHSRVRVCTVIGFPHGANRAEVKAYETQVAVAQGAREVDMVIPIGAMKSGDHKTVAAHVRAVVKAAIPGVITKVILENAFLTDEEKRVGSQIVRDEGAHYVKTSTGFGPSGATLEDVRLMREVVGPTLGVKAAGGIRDTDSARKMVEAGATRIGASASIQIAASH